MMCANCRELERRLDVTTEQRDKAEAAAVEARTKHSDALLELSECEDDFDDLNERSSHESERLKQRIKTMDSALLRAISALQHLPEDQGPIRKLASEAIQVCRDARPCNNPSALKCYGGCCNCLPDGVCCCCGRN